MVLNKKQHGHKHKGSGACELCPKTFWGGFFKPRNPGVHIILLIVLLNLFYTCAYLVMSTYYDTFSVIQHMGYVMILIANVIILVVGLLSIHFLVQKPEECRLSYCIFLHIGLIFASLVGALAVLLMLYQPTPEQMRNYARNQIRSYSRAPYFFRSLFKEKKCCGITKYKDVVYSFTNKTILTTTTNEPIFENETITTNEPIFVNETIFTISENETITTNGTVTYYRVPPACCRRENAAILRTCEEWLHVILNETVFSSRDEEYLYQEPCLKNGEGFSAILGTETYANYYRNVLGVAGVFIQILIILLVLNYYIWWRFPRVKPEHLRPTEFNRDIRNFMTCRWQVLRRDLKRRRRTSDEVHAKAVSGKSDFTLRHEIIKQSIASLGLIHRDLLEAKEKGKEIEMRAGSSQDLVSPADSSLEEI